MHHILQKIALIAFVAVLGACLDSTETVDIPADKPSYMSAYASVTHLPECTSEIEGMIAFVNDERMVRICADGAWNAIGKNSTKVDEKKSSCKTKMLKDSSAVKVICDGDTVAVILNGAKGDKGIQGEKGETGATGNPGATGATGDKGDKGAAGAAGSDGEPGAKGASGTYCWTWYMGDYSGYKIICDGDSVGVLTNGSDGVNAEDCTTESYDYSDRYNIYCDGTYRGFIDAGKNGEGCVADTVDGQLRIRCGSDTTSYIMEALGTCNEWREGVVARKGETYYICVANNWEVAVQWEYDTYGQSCYENGRVVKGNVTNDYYYCNNGAWRSATRVEYDTYGHECSKRGLVVQGNITKSKYYYCDTTWREASRLEYDTYGLDCVEDGSVLDGVVTNTYKYVCDGAVFREAGREGFFSETNVGQACVAATEGEKEFHYGDFWYAKLSCLSGDYGVWNIAQYVAEPERTYGVLTDSRDGKTYKTVKIGNQTWMAQNLNYADSSKFRSLIGGRSACYKNSQDSCAKYGRLYTWAAAMDSVRNGCGYEKYCSLNYPVQGVCPSGWHLPTKAEFETLLATVSGSDSTIEIAGAALKATNGWRYNERNGADAYGFAALPAGYRDEYNEFRYVIDYTFFWTSTETYEGSYNAYYAYLDYGYNNMYFQDGYKNRAQSVRCVKNGE